MTDKCKAKDPTTCRVHGIQNPVDIIEETLNKGRLTNNEMFELMEFKDRVENPDGQRTAYGVTIQYDDGTSDVFIGRTSDPYHATDFAFASVGDYTRISGVAYDPEDTRKSDYVEQGVMTADKYAAELNALENNYILLGDGEDTYVSERKVKKVHVF